ncbi:hypothetical protein E1H18_4186 [Caulobacter sp. RHG1]|nr:hypothetical protein [Caulobacter sp. RHG1]
MRLAWRLPRHHLNSFQGSVPKPRDAYEPTVGDLEEGASQDATS